MSGLGEMLVGNSYPGRVAGCARTGDGEVVACYALTGRSAASRERRLTVDGEGSLVAGSSTGAGHDRLRHYVAVTGAGRWLVVGNGEQVTVTADRLRSGLAPVEAVENLPYEPDPPLFTSRITAVCDRERPGDLLLAAARRPRGDRPGADVFTLSVKDLAVGDAVLLTTYRSQAGTVGIGAPYLDGRTQAKDAPSLLDELWAALPADVRIAAAVVPITPESPRYLLRN